MKEPKPSNLEKIKLEFEKIKNEVGQSENSNRVDEDFLTEEDWRIFESFLDLKKIYKDYKKKEKDKTISVEDAKDLKIKVKDILKKMEILRKALVDDKQKSRSYFFAFIRGLLTLITYDL